MFRDLLKGTELLAHLWHLHQGQASFKQDICYSGYVILGNVSLQSRCFRRFVTVVAQSCLTLCDPMDCTQHSRLPCTLLSPRVCTTHKLMSIESVMPSNHLILCHSLLLLPSIFSSIRVFSNELTLRIRWPKYWSFSFSISPSKEYSGNPLALTGLISLMSRGLSRVFSRIIKCWGPAPVDPG